MYEELIDQLFRQDPNDLDESIKIMKAAAYALQYQNKVIKSLAPNADKH